MAVVGEDSNRLAMIGEESTGLAAVEEKRVCFPAEVKAACDVSVAKEDSDDSDEEEGDPDYEEQASCFRDTWNSWYSRYFGRFEDTTKIPNKRFTYKKPEAYQLAGPYTTLQIFSLKVARIRGGLQWPLRVFGMVAVRDAVDHNRNMIFFRPRESCQILTREAPYLKLTGPIRAVVLVDPVTFEVDLKVKGTNQSEDQRLSFLAVTYTDLASLWSRLHKRDYASKLSTLEFELGSLVCSVEATIAVRVNRGSWPDGLRAQFAAHTASIGGAEVILLDSGDERVPVALDGSIVLSRCVASVEIFGHLEVCVKAWRGDEIVADKKKSFNAKKDGASHDIIGVGFCTMDVTISWSFSSLSL